MSDIRTEGARWAPALPAAVRGFSLVELMVVLALITIVAAMAAPNMIGMIRANQLSGASSELVSALQLARTEAIRRNAVVTACASSDGSTCSGSADWSRWIVRGRDNAASAAGSEQVDIVRDETLSGALELSGPIGGVSFLPSGMARSQEALVLCIPVSNPAENRREITVLVGGAVLTDKLEGGGTCP